MAPAGPTTLARDTRRARPYGERHSGLRSGPPQPLQVPVTTRHRPSLAYPELLGYLRSLWAGSSEPKRLRGKLNAEAPVATHHTGDKKERPAAGRETGLWSTAEAPAPPGTGSERYWSLPPFSVNYAPRTGSYHETGPTAQPPAPGDPRGFGVLRGGRVPPDRGHLPLILGRTGSRWPRAEANYPPQQFALRPV